MLNRSDVRDDNLLLEFDETTKRIRDHAKRKNIDLSRIKIHNKECEKIQRRYKMFYN